MGLTSFPSFPSLFNFDSSLSFPQSPEDFQQKHQEGDIEIPEAPGTVAVTDWANPGTMANDAAVGDVAWSNPDNVKLSNDTYADITHTDTPLWFSNYLKATNFSFSVPTNATITGIEVAIEHHAEDDGIGDHDIRLIDEAGTIGGDDKESNVPWATGIDEDFIYGGSSDLWGLTFTPAIVNHANFGLAMTGEQFAGSGEVTFKVDNIQIRVHYKT